MNDTIKSLKFKKVFEGCHHVYRAGYACNPLATIDRNDFGRRLWTVTVEGYGRLTDGCHDCFTLAEAKELVKRHLLRDIAEQAVALCDDDGEGGCTVGIYLGVPTVTADALIDLGRRIRQDA